MGALAPPSGSLYLRSETGQVHSEAAAQAVDATPAWRGRDALGCSLGLAERKYHTRQWPLMQRAFLLSACLNNSRGVEMN